LVSQKVALTNGHGASCIIRGMFGFMKTSQFGGSEPFL
jgi:hypothetical protein